MDFWLTRALVVRRHQIKSARKCYHEMGKPKYLNDTDGSHHDRLWRCGVSVDLVQCYQ